MTDGFRNSAGVDSSALYDPDIIGDGYNATWLKRTDGSTLKYALANYGTAGAVLGQRDSGGADVGPKWAAKGTTNYALGMNGQTYTKNGGRGSSTVQLTMNTDGTWTIATGTGSPTTGTWLNFGGSASLYTVQFVMSGFSNGPDPDGGSNSFTNGASTAVALTTARTCSCSSTASVLGATAANNGALVVKLFKSGVLVSTSSCGFNTSAAG